MSFMSENAKVIMYVLFSLSIITMATDLIISYPWEWSILCFYGVTISTLFFRLIPHYICSIFLHILFLVLAWVCILSTCFLKHYPLAEIRSNYVCNWLLLPLIIWLFFSAILYGAALTRSQTFRIIYSSVHSLVGLYIVEIFFWIACFYQRYLNNNKNNLGVVFEMMYMIFYFLIILTPQMMSTKQILNNVPIAVEAEKSED